MKIEDIEASMFRHLYEKLTVLHSIVVLEDTSQEDPTDLTKWVVLDSLDNNLGHQPVQHWFIHLAVQKGAPNSKHKLNELTDIVKDALDIGTPINLYSYDTGTLIGTMYVSDSSLSQVLTHRAGGMMRTLVISVTY
jgi:hypothetical protein